MASGEYYSFVNFFLLCLVFQKFIPINAAANCLNPTYTPDKKPVIDYYFNYEVADVKLSLVYCPIIKDSKGQLSVLAHMCSGKIDKETCWKDLKCLDNRMQSCFKKNFPDKFDDCDAVLPVNTAIGNCTCTGAADDILASNEAERLKLGIQTFPALVLNGKYDPCFKDYSANGIVSYVCKAYQYKLPFCKK